MSEPTTNQLYHLILADIAMAAAIRVYDSARVEPPDPRTYVPGQVRDSWMARTQPGSTKRNVLAMATAGVASLQECDAEKLAAMADVYGIPLSSDVVTGIAGHFQNRREAVLTYRR